MFSSLLQVGILASCDTSQKLVVGSQKLVLAPENLFQNALVRGFQ